MEKREDFLAIAVLKRGQGKKTCTHFFSLTLSQKLPVPFSEQTHTHSKHNTHVINVTESVFATTHHTCSHTQECLYETPK